MKATIKQNGRKTLKEMKNNRESFDTSPTHYKEAKKY
jgi:hypothetical protein